MNAIRLCLYICTSLLLTACMTKTIPLNRQSHMTVNKGQTMSYEYKSHGSVGFSAKYRISDPEIVGFTDRKIKYKHPRRSHMSGGDGGTGIFYFKALSPGETQIQIDHTFRGEVESQSEITITVE